LYELLYDVTAEKTFSEQPHENHRREADTRRVCPPKYISREDRN
jgi:hypothetical protein